MKIVIAAGIYPPDVGGPATYSQTIAREFAKRGIKIAVICYSDFVEADKCRSKRVCLPARQGSTQKFEVVRILRKYSKSIRYWFYFWNLLKLAKGCDVIYAQGPVSSGLPAVLVGKILRKKVALRLGGDYIWERAIDRTGVELSLQQYYKLGVFRKQGIIFKIFKWVLKTTDLIIFSTEFQRDIYVKYLRIKEGKTTVIKNAFPDLKEIPRDSFCSNQILFAGRVDKLKNLDFLIKVFSEVLPETNKNIQLRIIGDGLERKGLQELVEELHLEKSVIFENKVSHQKLLEIIQGCYFAVLPSLTEISPNFVLECIKLNKPILCTRETGLHKDFKDDLVFFNPCDKKDFLRKLRWLLDKQNYKRYQEQIKKIDTKRSWSELAKEHLLIFKKLK